MTAALSYNPRNQLAQRTLEYIQSLGVFTITPLPVVRTRKRTASKSVDAQLWSDLKGALQEVKDYRNGKIQMKSAEDLFDEL